VVNPARLAGANRRYVESKLPHLKRLLAGDPGAALRGADVAVVSVLLGAYAASEIADEPAETGL